MGNLDSGTEKSFAQRRNSTLRNFSIQSVAFVTAQPLVAYQEFDTAAAVWSA